MTVWDEVVGQEPVVATLERAVADANAILAGEPHAGSVMTHSWLFTGPPGSGRSVAAMAFAAALQCEQGGCGQCTACRSAIAGSHPDVKRVATELLSLRIDEMRELVREAALKPAHRRWQVIVIEDADRLTEQAADALLLSIEEPPPRTVWMLCAPTVEDIVPTIRSRSRAVQLRTPPTEAVTQHLVRTVNADPGMASFAARASQGHIGRARALALDAEARERRQQVLRLPFSLGDIGSCLAAAAALVEAAQGDAAAKCDALDAKETGELRTALGFGTVGKRPRHAQAALKTQEEEQKKRRTRVQRDSLDRALVDLLALYRDVLAIQLGTRSELINAELKRPEGRTDIEGRLDRLARDSTPEQTLRRMDAIAATREALQMNVAPLLALESMALSLRAG